MYFSQLSKSDQKSYLEKLAERLARDGFDQAEVDVMLDSIKEEKVANIPTLEAIEGGWDLW